jgi:hypothetical protein
MNNAELITELTYHANIEKRKLLSDAADALEAAEKRIAELEAQIPKEGEWIDIDGTMFAECSVCGKRHYGCTSPYCDMCGARMRGEHDGET